MNPPRNESFNANEPPWPHSHSHFHPVIGPGGEGAQRAPKRRRTNTNTHGDNGPNRCNKSDMSVAHVVYNGDSDATRHRHSSSNREHGIMQEGDATGSPRFLGSASGIYLIRKVYDVLGRSHVARRHRDAADVVPGEEDQLAGFARSEAAHDGSHQVPGGMPAACFWGADEMTIATGSGNRNGNGNGNGKVSFDTLLRWTEGYFKYWHKLFPILHGPSFLALLEHVSIHGIEALRISSPADAIIVRSVLSICLADSRQVGGRHDPFPRDLIYLNQEDVAKSLVFVLNSPASIKNTQAALCVELFLISMLMFNMASRVGGIVVRMAFNLGLHRCPGRYPNFSPQDAALRKRLWWSLYCLDRMICQTLGLPLGIRDDDIDVCPPSEEMHGTRSSGVVARQDRGFQQLQLLTLLSKHAKLRGMILELRNKNIRFRYDDPERVLQVQAELKRWMNEVYDLSDAHAHTPSRRSPSVDDEQGEDTNTSSDYIEPSHKTLFIILQHELIISLHRPLLSSDLKTASSQAAFQECINASKAIIDTAASNSRNKGQVERGSNTADAHLLWPSLTWSVWMSCFVLAYAAIEGVITAVSAKRYANRALRVLKLLSLRKTSWPEKCTLAVEQLIAFLSARDGDVSQRPTEPARSEGHTEASQEYDAERQMQSHPFPNGSNKTGGIGITQEVPTSNLPGLNPTSGFDFANTQILEGANDFFADPLTALDFANFAQDSSTQDLLDFNFDLDGFS
ncbi:fungal-specific transcription factor-like protein [Astrocystis sublimbata]|nr:fungal-specific transcription factor-like protein [Astrocystis sublimbata]KAI0198335.1 fungal-specific transcription factor-like protein [Astrocystis sublimbata]